MKRWICGWIGLLLAACAPGGVSAPEVTAAMAARSGQPPESLERGRSVYLAQCGRCHELIAPASLKTSDWKLVVPGMCWNAGLSAADEKAVLNYVLAAKHR
jgi:hypothetical protein